MKNICDNGDRNVNYQFKLLSAIAMIAVVAGHCGEAGIGLFFTWFPPYSWHLPLFMFISGYFYTEVSASRYIPYIIKKVKRLLVPMFVYNLIYGIFAAYIRTKGFSIGYRLSLKSLLFLPLVNGHQFAFNSPMWYVIPLFMCSVVYPLFRGIGKKCRYCNELQFGILFFSFVFTFYYDRQPFFYMPDDLKIFLSRFFLLFPFYHMGFVFKNKYESLLNSVSTKRVIIISLLIRLALIWIEPTHSMSFLIAWQENFENQYSIVVFLGCVNGIVILYEITKVIVDYIPRNAYMFIADNTYDIMANHMFGFFVLNTIIAIVEKIRNGFEVVPFEWSQYKTNVYYCYTPFDQFRILYLIFGIGVSLIIVYLKNKVKDNFSKVSA